MRYLDFYDARERLRRMLTDAAVWAIRRLNPSKDNGLSMRLHDLADQYDTRPTGQWEK